MSLLLLRCVVSMLLHLAFHGIVCHPSTFFVCFFFTSFFAFHRFVSLIVCCSRMFLDVSVFVIIRTDAFSQFISSRMLCFFLFICFYFSKSIILVRLSRSNLIISNPIYVILDI